MALIRVERLTRDIGAIVHDVDLSPCLSRDFVSSLRDALQEHLVLVLPRQGLSPAEHVRLGNALGELEPRHPLYPTIDPYENIMVIENGPQRPPDNEMWHADMTFRAQPPHCSLLQAQILPPVGGDTMFANMYQIYDDLSDQLKEFLADLSAEHDVRTGFTEIFKNNGETERANKMSNMDRSNSQCIHPVIAVHPATGRRYLNVNETFTSRVIELPKEESKAVLSMLFEFTRHPRYQVRHRWSVGDLVIWDNLATQHFAVGDYTEYRCMHRVTVKTLGTRLAEIAAL